MINNGKPSNQRDGGMFSNNSFAGSPTSSSFLCIEQQALAAFSQAVSEQCCYRTLLVMNKDRFLPRLTKLA
jgi:hypothetical protein